MILFLEARPILHLATSNLISNNCPHVQTLREETACDPYGEVEMGRGRDGRGQKGVTTGEVNDSRFFAEITIRFWRLLTSNIILKKRSTSDAKVLVV